MSIFRETLCDRMINLYGFEAPVVIWFCRLAEIWTGSDVVLAAIVEAHENHPKY